MAPLLKIIYFKGFYEFIIFLPIESQEEPNFPMAKSQAPRGTQSALLPTISGAHPRSLQDHTVEGVWEKNRAFL